MVRMMVMIMIIMIIMIISIIIIHLGILKFCFAIYKGSEIHDIVDSPRD